MLFWIKIHSTKYNSRNQQLHGKINGDYQEIIPQNNNGGRCCKSRFPLQKMKQFTQLRQAYVWMRFYFTMSDRVNTVWCNRLREKGASLLALILEDSSFCLWWTPQFHDGQLYFLFCLLGNVDDIMPVTGRGTDILTYPYRLIIWQIRNSNLSSMFEVKHVSWNLFSLNDDEFLSYYFEMSIHEKETQLSKRFARQSDSL